MLFILGKICKGLMKAESMSKNMVNKRYVNIKVVSEYTSLPVNTLYEWAGTGRIPSVKIGRRVLFDLHDIDMMMASLKRTHNQEDKIIEKFLINDI